MKKLMGIVPAERVLPPLLAYLQHTNSHIREMAINVLIQTLLSAPRQPLDLYRSALDALSREPRTRLEPCNGRTCAAPQWEKSRALIPKNYVDRRAPLRRSCAR